MPVCVCVQKSKVFASISIEGNFLRINNKNVREKIEKRRK